VEAPAGGEHFTIDGQQLQTLTPTSPLGRTLLGLEPDDEAEVESPQGTRVYETVALASSELSRGSEARGPAARQESPLCDPWRSPAA
jgi:hypothetical protein